MADRVSVSPITDDTANRSLRPGTYELTKRIEVNEDGTYRFVDMPDGPDTEYVKGFWHKTRSQVRKIDGVSVGSTASTGALVSPEQTTDHAGQSVSPVTDDMVERATIAVANVADEFRESGEASAHGYAVAALSAALAGCTVVRLPEPDEVLTGPTSARWNSDGRLVAEGYVVAAVDGPSGPKVNVRGGPYMDADLAEQYAAMLLAAAREARRLATEQPGSQVGDQHGD